MKLISSLDEARAGNPDLGFALYGYEPGGAVTLEVHTPDGEVFTWSGATEADVFALAFPAVDDVGSDDRHEPVTDIFD